jgi:hypothetical protein
MNYWAALAASRRSPVISLFTLAGAPTAVPTFKGEGAAGP